jgi:uncharacterized Zn finger protein
VVSAWAERWRAVLADPSPQIERRLRQGGAYHRSGRVSDVRVGAGCLTGRVQGSRATPFLIEVAVAMLGDEQWAWATAKMAGQARYRAALLAGREPDGLDAELEAAGVPLFPRVDELASHCGCADSLWPCAHVAGLWEAVGVRIDDDPFVLLGLRGRGRQRLLGELAAVRPVSSGSGGGMVALDNLPATGWTRARDNLEDIELPASAPRTPVPALRLRGDPPGWTGGISAEDLFGPLIERAAQVVVDLES